MFGENDSPKEFFVLASDKVNVAYSCDSKIFNLSKNVCRVLCGEGRAEPLLRYWNLGGSGGELRGRAEASGGVNNWILFWSRAIY